MKVYHLRVFNGTPDRFLNSFPVEFGFNTEVEVFADKLDTRDGAHLFYQFEPETRLVAAYPVMFTIIKEVEHK